MTVSCYSNLLSKIYKYPTIPCAGLTVGEFADKYPRGIYLVRVSGHLTVVIDNCIYDIFDCRNSMCDIVWEVD